MTCKMLVRVVLTLACTSMVSSESLSEYLKSVRSCFSSNQTVLCLKENAVDAINNTIYSDQPLNLGFVEITRDVNYRSEITEENIPANISQRSLELSDIIYKKIEEFFKSRIIKFKVGDAFEARKKGGGGGYGGGYGGGGKKGGGTMLMMGGMAMAGMMAQLFMGKIAFLAGTALMLAKMALVLSLVSALKKSSGDGGGKETAHVVYATQSDSYGHGGGWHRSLNQEDSQQTAYNAYSPQGGPYKK